RGPMDVPKAPLRVLGQPPQPAGIARPWPHPLVVPLPFLELDEAALNGPDASRLLDVDGQDPAADNRMDFEPPQQRRLALETSGVIRPDAPPEHLQHHMVVAVGQDVRLVARGVSLDGLLELVAYGVGDAARPMRQVQKNARCNLHPARPLAGVLHVRSLPGDDAAWVNARCFQVA